MKDKDKFTDKVDDIIQECEEQIKDLEKIAKIKNDKKSEEE